jgi:hypothetical protein
MGPKFKGLAIAIMALIVSTGVAYGLPHSTTLSSGKLKPNHASSQAHGAGRSGGSQEAEPTESPDPEQGSSEADSEGAIKSHGVHGAAVAAAAHCSVKGPAHGALVSRVASRAIETVAQARAACAAAKAGAGSKLHGRSAQAHGFSHGSSDEQHGQSGSAHPSKVNSSKA